MSNFRRRKDILSSSIPRSPSSNENYAFSDGDTRSVDISLRDKLTDFFSGLNSGNVTIVRKVENMVREQHNEIKLLTTRIEALNRQMDRQKDYYKKREDIIKEMYEEELSLVESAYHSTSSSISSGALQNNCNNSGELQNKCNNSGELQNKGINSGELQNKCNNSGELQNKGINSGELQKKRNNSGELQNKLFNNGALQEKCNNNGAMQNKLISSGDLQRKLNSSGVLQKSCNSSRDPQNICTHSIELQNLCNSSSGPLWKHKYIDGPQNMRGNSSEQKILCNGKRELHNTCKSSGELQNACNDNVGDLMGNQNWSTGGNCAVKCNLEGGGDVGSPNTYNTSPEYSSKTHVGTQIEIVLPVANASVSPVKICSQDVACSTSGTNIKPMVAKAVQSEVLIPSSPATVTFADKTIEAEYMTCEEDSPLRQAGDRLTDELNKQLEDDKALVEVEKLHEKTQYLYGKLNAILKEFNDNSHKISHIPSRRRETKSSRCQERERKKMRPSPHKSMSSPRLAVLESKPEKEATLPTTLFYEKENDNMKTKCLSDKQMKTRQVKVVDPGNGMVDSLCGEPDILYQKRTANKLLNKTKPPASPPGSGGEVIANHLHKDVSKYFQPNIGEQSTATTVIQYNDRTVNSDVSTLQTLTCG